MAIRRLDSMHYSPNGVHDGGAIKSSWKILENTNPDWPTIEAAVRRLDRDVYPYVWLYIEPPTDGNEPLGLNIMGGRGEFALSISSRAANLYYFDESRRDTRLRVWESDQGSLQQEKYLCNDLERVFSIARHFAATGLPHPLYRWVE